MSTSCWRCLAFVRRWCAISAQQGAQLEGDGKPARAMSWILTSKGKSGIRLSWPAAAGTHVRWR